MKRTFIIIHSNRDIWKNSLKAIAIFIIVALKLSQRNRFLNSQSCYVDQKRELASDSLCWYLIKILIYFYFFYRNIDWGCNTHHLKPGNSGGLWFKIFLWNEWSLAARRKLINYTRNTGVWRIFGPRNKFIRWTFSSLRLFVVKTWISGGIFEWLIRSISRNWESWNLSKVWFSSRSWVSFVVGMTVQYRKENVY